MQDRGGDRSMIDAKQAIVISRGKALELLDEPGSSLEEIEQETYHGHDVWSITLGHPKKGVTYALGIGPPLEYKRFLIDVETGALLAMKIRDVP
jgi:hypothetical protein